MLLGVVARSFRRIAAAAGFEFQTGLGSPTARVDYQGSASAYAIDTALGSPFGAQGYQVGSDAFAFVTGLGTPTATTGQSGNPADIGVVTGMGTPTATVAYQGDPADIGVVTEVPTIATGYTYTNTEAQTFEAAIADTTAWDDTYRGHLDQLFSDLKSGQVNGTNVLAELDMLYLHNAPDSATALTDIIDPTRTATAVNSPTFTAGEGFTGNGTSARIDTGYTPSTDGTNYVLNDASTFVWVRSATTGTGDYYCGGSVLGIYVDSSSLSNPWKFRGPNSGSGYTNATTASSAAVGLLLGQRTNSNTLQGFFNGAQEGSVTFASSAVASDEQQIFSFNNGGSPLFYSDGQVSAWGCGASLTVAQNADLYDALNRFLQAREAAPVIEAFNAQASTELTATEQEHLIPLIGDLKLKGIWDQLDMLYLHDLDTEANSLRDFVDPTRTATAVNSPTFTANEGFTGNGTTSYINTNYAPTDGSNWALNSASMGAWVRTAASAGTRGLIASNSSTAYAYLASDNNQIEFANLNNITATFLTASFPTGLLAVNRSGASAQQVYADGVSRNSNTLSSGSFVSNRDLYVLCINSNGSASFFSDAQVSASFAGASLTANQHADLYDALNTYRTAREAV